MFCILVGVEFCHFTTGALFFMELTIEQLENNIKKISLRGRMDIGGVDQIALRFSSEASMEKANVIVDLTDLEFMASVGLGTLVRSYKALKLRGGKMVLLNPRKVVELVLESTQVNTLIPICYDLRQACEELMQNSPEA
jgi:anti-anti-sigma factor